MPALLRSHGHALPARLERTSSHGGWGAHRASGSPLLFAVATEGHNSPAMPSKAACLALLALLLVRGAAAQEPSAESPITVVPEGGFSQVTKGGSANRGRGGAGRFPWQAAAAAAAGPHPPLLAFGQHMLQARLAGLAAARDASCTFRGSLAARFLCLPDHRWSSLCPAVLQMGGPPAGVGIYRVR